MFAAIDGTDDASGAAAHLMFTTGCLGPKRQSLNLIVSTRWWRRLTCLAVLSFARQCSADQIGVLDDK